MLAMLLAGCRAEDTVDAGGTDVILQVQNIVFVQDETDARTRADEADVSQEEGRVDDLWFLAYPVDGQGEKLVRRLSANDLLSSTAYKTFALRIAAGTYHVYVAANLPGVYTHINEDELKNIVLHFREGNTWSLPGTTGGLPMFYAFPNEITIEPAVGQTLQADLTILCAKLSYKLQFNNADFSQGGYGSNGFRVTGVSIRNVAGSSALTSPKNHTPTTLADYTCPVPDGTGSGNWSVGHTIYLPEHYTDNADRRTVLWVEGVETKSDGSDIAVKHVYCLPLGGNAFTGTAANFQGGNLERGTWYDLTAKIVGKGEQDISVSVDTYDWSTDNLFLDFAHTELWLSRTGVPDVNGSYDAAEQIQVTSLNADEINYKTTASSITTECIEKIDGKQIVLASVNTGTKTIRFSVNPEIPVSSYGSATQGTVRVAIKANNIVKYVDVQYDVRATLEVTPLTVNIQTLEGGTSVTQTQYKVAFETNLGGIKLSTNTLGAPSGKGSVSVTCSNTNAMTGEIILQTDGASESTWEATFSVSSVHGDQSRTVRVVVSPPLQDYYTIHFIAINDDCDVTGQAKIHRSLYSNGQPTDGWDEHNIYIYTQYGVTADNDIPQSVWYFFNLAGLSVPFWPGVAMQQDSNNPGWLHYNLPINRKGKDRDGNETEKLPLPGETLIMFNSGTSSLQYRHRYPYDMEPGVMLFDFAGREGWFVFDPTSNAYEFWEEKPELYLATYTMYTKDSEPIIDNWFRKYGVQPNDDGTTGNLQIWGNRETQVDRYYNLRTYTDCGISGWNRTELDLWAIKGSERKSIIVKNGQDNSDTRYGVLFGGRIFKDNTGYYDNGWHEGVPPAN